jgi:hypothetical protein
MAAHVVEGSQLPIPVTYQQDALAGHIEGQVIAGRRQFLFAAHCEPLSEEYSFLLDMKYGLAAIPVAR